MPAHFRCTRCHCCYVTHTLSVPHRICSQKDESCTNSVMRHLRLGQRVKREHKQERPSARATKRNEYVTHGADTCAVGGLRGLSVMVGLREEQHNVVSVEWITTATRERADCFLCENHPHTLPSRPVCLDCTASLLSLSELQPPVCLLIWVTAQLCVALAGRSGSVHCMCLYLCAVCLVFCLFVYSLSTVNESLIKFNRRQFA